ncbi:MAG: LysR family transcriptional regulator [Myxococcota bacterium]|nr:LysR family transcriptional regulator [Myxococcota bacterium]
MQFVRRVRTIWSWLPTFRAVAETEHLPTAAQELDVVASSLSRTVKLLEDELGVPLFDRSAKSLVLNEVGRRLLTATRDAMRIVDEALAQATGDEMRGTVTAVASRDIGCAVLPRACAALANRHADIVASSAVADDADIPEMLVRGDADVALMIARPDDVDLVVTEVGSWTRSLYARAGRTVDTSSLRCVAVGTGGKHVDDGWPPRVERHVAAWASDERSALEIVARSGLVAVAFDHVARTSEVFKRVIRLPTPHIEPRTILLVHRRAVGSHRRTNALVEAIRESLNRLAT